MLSHLLAEVWTLIPMFFLLCASGIISGSETALCSISLENEELFSRPGRITSGLSFLLSRPRDFLTTALLLNMMVNVAFFTLSVKIARGLKQTGGGHQVPTTISIIALLLVVTFGEVLPKMMAVRYPVSFSRMVSVPFAWLTRTIYPVVGVFVNRTVSFATRLFQEDKPPHLAIREIKRLIDFHKSRGALHHDEEKALLEIVEFGHARVREIMDPRTSFVFFDLEHPEAGVKAEFVKSRRRFLVAHRGDPDNPTGVIFSHEAIFKVDEDPSSLVRKLEFVPETKSVESMLADFEKTGEQASFVVDEYGEVTGVVTTEDIFQEILGEMTLISSGETPEFEHLGVSQYRINGGFPARDFFEAFAIDEDPSGTDTVAGLILRQLGRMPRAGEEVETPWGTFVITQTRRRMIQSTIFTLSPNLQENR